MGSEIYGIIFAYFEFDPKGHAVPDNMDIRDTAAVGVLNPCREGFLRQVLP